MTVISYIKIIKYYPFSLPNDFSFIIELLTKCAIEINNISYDT